MPYPKQAPKHLVLPKFYLDPDWAYKNCYFVAKRVDFGFLGPPRYSLKVCTSGKSRIIHEINVIYVYTWKVAYSKEVVEHGSHI
jgi:hypothetical protein